MSKKVKRQSTRVTGSTETTPVSVVAKTPPATFSRSALTEFNPDYTYVKKDLKRIGTLAGSFFIVLVVLSFFLK
jgi:hypothetical protein